MSTSKGAGQKVSEIPELLETILVDLPYGIIVRARLVSLRFKIVIESSLPLQRATFRAPVTNNRLFLKRDEINVRSPPTGNTLYSASLMPALTDRHYNAQKKTSPDLFLFHPLLAEHDRCSRKFLSGTLLRPQFLVEGSELTRPSECSRTVLINFDPHTPKKILEVLKSPFWHSSFITQPPCTTINIHVRRCGELDDGPRAADIHDKHGVTFGQVAEVFDKIFKQNEEEYERKKEVSGEQNKYREPPQLVLAFRVGRSTYESGFGYYLDGQGNVVKRNMKWMYGFYRFSV